MRKFLARLLFPYLKANNAAFLALDQKKKRDNFIVLEIRPDGECRFHVNGTVNAGYWPWNIDDAWANLHTPGDFTTSVKITFQEVS